MLSRNSASNWPMTKKMLSEAQRELVISLDIETCKSHHLVENVLAEQK